MLHLFSPNYRCPSISEIPIPWLSKQGVKAIILDLDNTLMPWDKPVPVEANAQWVRKVKAAGISVVLLSNNGGDRLKKVSESLGVPAVGWGAKPFSLGFRRAMTFLEVKGGGEVLVIGDQLLTDVLGAKKLKLRVMWVESLAINEFAFTRLTRKVERLLVRQLVKKGLMPGGRLNENCNCANED